MITSLSITANHSLFFLVLNRCIPTVFSQSLKDIVNSNGDPITKDGKNITKNNLEEGSKYVPIK